MVQRRIGRYRVLENIASGGQATVHRAWDSQTGRVVALKVIHPLMAGDPAFLERFHREASMAASLSHPNVIQVYEVGQDGDTHFIAMEYLPDSLNHVVQAEGPLHLSGPLTSSTRSAVACRRPTRKE